MVGTESEYISELFGLTTIFVSGDHGHGVSGDVFGIPGTNGLPPDAFADARRVLVPMDIYQSPTSNVAANSL